jgi:hypothetical protein
LQLTEQQAFGFPQWHEGRLDSYVIVAGGRDPQTQELFQVTIIKYRAGATREPQVVAFAHRARWNGTNEWVLYDGWWRTAEGQLGTFRVFRAEPVAGVQIRRTPLQIEALLTEVDARSFRQLRQQIRFYEREGVEPMMVRQLTVELYNKIAVPLASLIFALVGAPLAIRPPAEQRGGRFRPQHRHHLFLLGAGTLSGHSGAQRDSAITGELLAQSNRAGAGRRAYSPSRAGMIPCWRAATMQEFNLPVAWTPDEGRHCACQPHCADAPIWNRLL